MYKVGGTVWLNKNLYGRVMTAKLIQIEEDLATILTKDGETKKLHYLWITESEPTMVTGMIFYRAFNNSYIKTR